MKPTLPPWILTAILTIGALALPGLVKYWLDSGLRQEALVRELQLALVKVQCEQARR